MDLDAIAREATDKALDKAVGLAGRDLGKKGDEVVEIIRAALAEAARETLEEVLFDADQAIRGLRERAAKLEESKWK